MDGQVVAKGLQRRKQGRRDMVRVIDIYDAEGRLLSHERAGDPPSPPPSSACRKVPQSALYFQSVKTKRRQSAAVTFLSKCKRGRC